MTNVLEAIANIIEFKNYNIKSQYISNNRMNHMGDALENFVMDAFANTLGSEENQEKIQAHSDCFSWLGNPGNPPDFMIKGGDAIEVKKTMARNTALQLNSSYPKATLKSDSTLINKSCRLCEEWNEKDLIYAVGHVSKKILKSLWMVYGNIYAANHDTYSKISSTISDGINAIPNVEFHETNELGNVRRIDPLGITKLRIRGMWIIENPRRVFDYLPKNNVENFELVTIIPQKKYYSFSSNSINKIESIKDDNFSILNIKVKDPNNPAVLIDCKLIQYFN